jgi:Arc/MetJ-type ribon-helix-helix transcriptional regulator
MATLTITLLDDLANDISALVAAGEYPNEDAVIANWLRPAEEPAEVTAWLKQEVPAQLAALDAGTEQLLTPDQFMAQLAEWRSALR